MNREARQRVVMAVYWADVDRRYRASGGELAAQQYHCPRCPDQLLAPTVYKRESGKSVKLLGCHVCLFLVRVSDILNHHALGDT